MGRCLPGGTDVDWIDHRPGPVLSPLEACANIEKQYTEDCAAQNDPCLESGCSVVGVEGETCLQPLLMASLAYHKACAAEWMKFFRNPNARIDW